MANIMEQLRLSNKPSRNGFDLSVKRNFSAKAGELLPVWFKPVIPDDDFSIDFKSFTRTQQLNTAAYCRMREYYDVYFVPMETIWNKGKHVLTQMYQNLQHANGPLLSDNKSFSGDMPYITSEQIANYLQAIAKTNTLFTFNRAFNTAKLLQYLGYGDFFPYCDGSKNWTSNPMQFNEMYSIFPLLVYQKVYADFFRYTQWEKPNPSSFNCDYIKGTDDCNVDLSKISQDFNFLDLRYSNWNKDLYFGLQPSAQYGDAAAIPLNPSGDGLSYGFISASGGSLDGGAVWTGVQGSKLGNSGKVADFLKMTNTTDIISRLSVLAIRQAEAQQRWKEISQSVDQDYKAQIQAHYGISVSDYLSDQARYIGGLAQSLDINPITNSNLADDNSAVIKANGTIAQNGTVRFHSQGEYGFLICVYHAQPIFDYVCGSSDPMVKLTNALDYPVLELDRIGMQSVTINNLINRPTDTFALPDTPSYNQGTFDALIKKFTFMGYAPRYIYWKTDIDRSLGFFTTKTGNTWLCPLNDQYLYESLIDNLSEGLPDDLQTDASKGLDYTWSFFKVNPRSLDPLFVAQCDDSFDSDQFLVSAFIQCNVVRSLDYNGLPY